MSLENNSLTNNLLTCLPVISIHHVCPLPGSSIKLNIINKINLESISKSEQFHDRKVILAISHDALSNLEKASFENHYNIGLLANVLFRVQTGEAKYSCKFEIMERVLIKDIYKQAGDDNNIYLNSTYEKLEKTISDKKLYKAYVDKLNELVASSKNVFNRPDVLMNQVVTNEEFIDNVIEDASNILFDSKIQILTEQDLTKRAEKSLEIVNSLILNENLEKIINDKLKKSLDDSQREYYLREKIKVIQQELGDKVKLDTEIEELRKKIKTVDLPEKIRLKVLKELDKYQTSSSNNPDGNIIRNYIDFILALPWNIFTTDCEDLNAVKDVLDKNHYGLEKIKERVLEYLAVKIHTKKNPSTIICFSGPPGVGKTTLAKSIAEALGRKFVKLSLGGVSDESEIRGHRRTYIGALPGKILKSLKDAKTQNPVILLDEIDKMTSDFKGDPASAMLEVLDPEQNKFFQDNYLEEEFDLSNVLFITTANYIENIPAPLKDRMEIIELSSYTEFEKIKISKLHLIPKELNNHGLTSDDIDIKENVIKELILSYTRETGVRELDRLISAICRKVVKKKLIEKHTGKFEVNLDNLEEFVGKVKFFNNELRNKEEVGIVTGLAYTSFGGDTLDIEVTTYPGKGDLILTGKLGEVMQESAKTAFSLCKHIAYVNNIDFDFKSNDIHIHVPEGAVPKDGPSAGVTLSTAIYSLLTKRPVSQNIGMTGEISLRGQVLPIGGLKEKSIAALRTGLKKIYIPKENERDIQDIPIEVKEKLEIVSVQNIDELFSYIFKLN